MSVFNSPFNQVFHNPFGSPFNGDASSGTTWTPAEWFLANEQGIWLDPSDFSTMFQDAAGTTPVTAVEQPVGLALDKRLGAARGVEQIIDPEFNDPTKWTTTPSWTISGGKATHNGSAADYIYTATEAPAVGEWYEATVVVSTFAAGSALSIYFGQTPAIHSITAVGTHRIIGRSPGTGLKFSLRASNATGLQTVVESFSVRPLPGNHASQTTAASKPVLSARKNKLLATTTLATQAVTLTASAHTLSFKGTGTVTLTGASTAGPLVGTGAGNRVSLTFTPTAGSVTLTVSGSVTEAQLEDGSAFTTYQRVTTATDYDTVGFPHYLKFDGVDDFLTTASINFTATDKMTVVAGVRKLSDAGEANVVTLGDSGALNGAFSLKAPSGAAPNFAIAARGTIGITQAVTPYASPSTAVLAASADIAAPSQLLRVNQVGTSWASSLGTGNFGTYPLYIGRRNTTAPLSGHLYQLVVRGALTANLTPGETFTAGKTGITL